MLHFFDPGGSEQGGQPLCIGNMLKELIKNEKVKQYKVVSADNGGGMSLVNMVYILVKVVSYKESEENERGVKDKGDTNQNGKKWAAVKIKVSDSHVILFDARVHRSEIDVTIQPSMHYSRKRKHKNSLRNSDTTSYYYSM